MNNKRPAAPPPALITPGDIYYILFRHKWKIILISVLGIGAAVAFYYYFPTQLLYQSEARLLIQSVRDSKTPSIVGVNESRPKDDEGASIIETERAILSSLDVAFQSATNFEGGPQRIMEKAGNTNELAAAMFIRAHLKSEPLRKSSVVRILFEHPDQIVAQQLLDEIIKTYKKKHTDIHAGQSIYKELFDTQISQLKQNLRNTEEKLANAKTNMIFISVADSKKETQDQIVRVRQAIWDTRAEVAEHEATRNTLLENLNGLTSSDRSLGTNQPSRTNDVFKVPVLSGATKTEYRRLRVRLEREYEKENQLLAIYTAENKQVKIIQEQIAQDEERKQQLEEENPALIAVKAAEYGNGGVVSGDPTLNLRIAISSEAVKLISLAAKLRMLESQSGELDGTVKNLNEKENGIAGFERDRKLLEQQVTYFEQNMAQARIDSALAKEAFNISVVQSASPAGKDSAKVLKTSLMIAFGSIGFALALAFFVEFFLDPTLKRPLDIENKLGLSLFLSIPKLSLNGSGAHLNGHKPAGLLSQGMAKEAAANQEGKVGLPTVRTEVPPWDPHHTLRPFVEALRDRLITYFEVKNLTHKPKLVAVTSCAEGAGVSTVAAGLASSLSETGDGNVLLVDMNQEHGATHQFYKGDLALDDALELEKREDALVSENLYVVSEATKSNKLPSALPKRFKNLVPRLRASDYDYIIFDMQPVSQISITPRLARFMDSVLMVVEAEQTDKDVVKRATDVLLESEANVGVVMNKWRTYVPKRLAQDL